MSKLIIALLFTFGIATQAFAWGQTGHRVTGVIAEQHLTDSARKEIENILGTESLAEASTWPDFMRASDDPFWKRKAGPYHYVTVPEGKSYSDVGAPKKGDAITALRMFAKSLKDPAATKKQKALALRFTIHIIGDLHQPLHVGNGKDRGGNSVKVVFFNKNTNLHAVWDSGMIDREGLSYSEMASWLEQKITPVQVTAWSVVDPLVWVAESAMIRDTIYPDEQYLSWGYSFQHIAMVHQRLSQAGIRIAAYLNTLYEK
jgi:hypothetical protein